MGELRKVDSSELIWNPAPLAALDDVSLGTFLTTRMLNYT